MPMNVNEGMHNPGVPFFPVSEFFFANNSSHFYYSIATGTTNDESGIIIK
jgi:hypothetical protein